MSQFTNDDGIQIVLDLIIAVQTNKQYLSDLDGAIGDGDHGVNMNKGFTLCREELQTNPGNIAHGLKVLSKVLIMKIGGSMGPLYGYFFKSMAAACDGSDTIDADVFEIEIVYSGIEALECADIGGGKVYEISDEEAAENIRQLEGRSNVQ